MVRQRPLVGAQIEIVKHARQDTLMSFDKQRLDVISTYRAQKVELNQQNSIAEHSGHDVAIEAPDFENDLSPGLDPFYLQFIQPGALDFINPASNQFRGVDQQISILKGDQLKF